MKDIGRIVRTSFWNDEKVVNTFSPEDKYFFLYLLTNPHTTQLGIYHFVPKIAAFELGYSIDSVMVLLDRFDRKYGIIKYSKTTSEIAIKNYLRHSIVKGGKPVADCLIKDSKAVKDKSLLAYVYNNIHSIEELNVTVKEFIEYLSTVISNDNDNDNDNERIVDDSSENVVSAEVHQEHSKAGEAKTVLAAWNTMAKAKGMSVVRALPVDSDRYKQLKTRLAQYGIDAVLEAIANVGASDYLPEQRWFDFGWFVRPNNFPKVLEGKYGKAKQAAPKVTVSEPKSTDDIDQMSDDEYDEYFMKTYGGV